MRSRKWVLTRTLSMIIIMTVVIACGDKNVLQPSKGGSTIPKTLATISPWWKIIDKIKFKYIPGGLFCLGSSSDKDPLSRGDESPQTKTRLAGFWIMETEVTNLDYGMCEEAGVCAPPQTAADGVLSRFRNPKYQDYPVVGVNWDQANMYCHWIDGRLPTEAEWEKAARGENCFRFPWGDEKPTCDLLNMKGCNTEPGPTKPGSYPKGASPFGVLDMAGNVRELVQDFYSPDTYGNISRFNPTGPAEGKLRSVRGGGWNDFEENVRSTARGSIPPNNSFEDVGFRCVPTTDGDGSYAPFCPGRFTPLCEDPDVPPRDQPCTPGLQRPGEKGVTIGNFGCPARGQVTILFDSNGGGNTGYFANVNGEDFQCNPSKRGEDLISCAGSEQKMGSKINITVCAGSPASPASSGVSANPVEGITLASLIENSPFKTITTSTQNCPDGYIWEAAPPTTALAGATGHCVRDPKAGCPQGWFVSALLNCQPENEEACPPTTQFSRDQKGCIPEKECPDGFIPTDKGTCEPEQNDSKLCPPGYYFDRKIQCCQPIKGDNFGCDNTHNFDVAYNRCMPTDGNGCGYNTIFDGYNTCQKIPFQAGDLGRWWRQVIASPVPKEIWDKDVKPLGANECPGNLTLAAANVCNTPPGDYTDEKPDPNATGRPGGEPQQGGCPAGALMNAAYNRCFSTDEDGCPYTYHMDRELKRCVPDNGPGSPCPPYYKFNRLANCCSPIPGTDGARCPGNEQAVTAGAPAQTNTAALFMRSAFDPQQGFCEPTRTGGTPDCPPGYPSNNAQTCSFDTQTAALMMQTGGDQTPTYNQGNCPATFWDQGRGACNYQLPACRPYEYRDPYLGYCVPLGNDCCPLGQNYSAMFTRCAPIQQDDQQRTPTEPCNQGYENVNGRCLLIGRSAGGGLCWTISVNVPKCIGPCKVGQYYNQATGQCDDKPPQQACKQVCTTDRKTGQTSCVCK